MTFPARTELPVLPSTSPSPGEQEFVKYESIALRVPMGGVGVNDDDNIIDLTWKLTVGGTVFVRARPGGFYMVRLQRDRRGWFVVLGDHPTRVIQDAVRSCWVVKELV